MASKRNLGCCQKDIDIPLRIVTSFLEFVKDDCLSVIELSRNHLLLLLSEHLGLRDLDDCQRIPCVALFGEDVKGDVLKLKLTLCHFEG